jgi:hypothetical protein
MPAPATRPLFSARFPVRFPVLCSALCSLLLLPAAARAQSAPGDSLPMTPATVAPATTGPAEAWQPPVLTLERYNEDWSVLADPANRTGQATERFKYIPLDATGRTYLTTGLEVRLRNEDYHGNVLGNPAAPDDGYLWIRAMPYADLHVGLGGGTSEVRAFVQPIIAYAVGVRPAASAIDQTRFDMLQAFADVKLDLGTGTTLRLRAGREMMSLGTERLVGTRYGPNVPLAFDGARAILHHDRLTVNAFFLRPVEPGLGTLDDHTSPSRALWGAYATRLMGPAGVDLYYLGYRNRKASFQQGSGREVRHTIGARFFGKEQGWHWNVEGMGQFGQFTTITGPATIGAWSLGSEIGHGFAAAPLKPDVTLRFNMASGDSNANDHHLGTFNALFPKGKYFGELSPVGPYNLVNLQPVVTLDLGHGVSAAVMGAAYWRQSTGDGVYDIPGHLLAASGGSQARFVGKEAEMSLQWRATHALTLEGSLSYFRSGTFLRDTGLGRDIRMIGLEANYRF